ncbi:MAG TPA: DUF1636 domain-containing protein [Acetobacteraceae bacterium]|jgi:predicted metal-binding protein|nr:DUF1636 domain-containing protein [Acetobacteraceae bacterium]
MTGRIVVCITCNRYADPASGEPRPGLLLSRALADAGRGHGVAVRTVECLNGCPHPCTAALRAPGKCVLRFSGLTADDAPALIEAAQHYAETCDGDIPKAALPPRLRDKLSLRVGATILA